MFVLITGAYGGIGREVCHQYLRQDDNIIVTGKSSSKLQTFANDLSQTYHKEILAIPADLIDDKQIAALFKTIHQHTKQLDVVIDCAGTLLESSLMMIRPGEINHAIQSNLTSAILLTQQASKFMLRNKKGVIVLMSSIVARQGSVGQSVYGAAKAGIEGLTISLAKELGQFGIRVNAIAPGFIDTPLVEHYSNEDKKRIIGKTSLGRMGSTKDIASAVSFLTSEQASFITGQILGVDGGLAL